MLTKQVVPAAGFRRTFGCDAGGVEGFSRHGLEDSS
jgi:hypothetical protein